MTPQIQELIYSAIDEVNSQLPPESQIEKKPSTILMGQEGAIDSLSFVNLTMAVETEIQERFGKSVVLVNEKTIGGDEHPFRTIETLGALVERLVKADGD